MRFLVLAFVCALSTAPAALAAPTCDDVDGQAAKCGAASATPAGWKPAAEAPADQDEAQPTPLTSTQLFGMVCFIGGLLALFALLPDFEDGKGGGWDRQEDDD